MHIPKQSNGYIQKRSSIQPSLSDGPLYGFIGQLVVRFARRTGLITNRPMKSNNGLRLSEGWVEERLRI